MNYPRKSTFMKLLDYVYSRWCPYGRFVFPQIVDVIPELNIDEKTAYRFASFLARCMLEAYRTHEDEYEKKQRTLLMLRLVELLKQKQETEVTS